LFKRVCILFPKRDSLSKGLSYDLTGNDKAESKQSENDYAEENRVKYSFRSAASHSHCG
jgi:hypothetical protein